ncbi:uncharacterized protein [Gossypium hirsutum]|uniref:Gag-Pol polyprotein n=1 Tax=Gossypium hirsutum TaxID=3635 RepID=A0A1U8PR69_GOSHI|nr:uncharacterized protein LOC107961080 [Gossypium hirsutum]
MSKFLPSQSKKSREMYSRSHVSAGHSYRNRRRQNLGFRSQATSVASMGNAKPSKAECPQCGRRHFGNCRVREGSCFKCVSLDYIIKDCPEMMGKEKFQSPRPSGTASRGRPSRNIENGFGSKNVMRDIAVMSGARAPARAYAIHTREDATFPDVITAFLEDLPLETAPLGFAL